MPSFPVWKEMTVEQKFEFLHEWLMNVEGRLKNVRADIQDLHERLQKVEAANVQPPIP
jgi:uncharacterized protein YydD (DUF2326 family)